MRIFFLLLVFSVLTFQSKAQLFKKPFLSGIYLQWGYNRDWFTRSNIHLSDGKTYDFTIHKVTAQDRPDFEGFWNTPLDVTIPQNSFRIGFYLNQKRTHAIEINFDHAKYVMDDYKTRRVTGTIHGRAIDKDTLMTPDFVHFEHTNGANFYHINYVGQQELWHNKKRVLATVIYKAGAGVVVPRSDVTIMGKQLDNEYHIAGYIISAEAGARFYPLKNLFFELTGKGGFANYLNVLTVAGGTAKHKFGYVEVVGLIGYDIPLNKKRWERKQQKN